MIWEFKKSIIKFVLPPLFTKFHVLLSLPTSRSTIPGFPLHLDKPQLIFLDLLETLSQVKINPVLVLSLTLCQVFTASRKVLDLHLRFYLTIWNLSVTQQFLRWPVSDTHLDSHPCSHICFPLKLICSHHKVQTQGWSCRLVLVMSKL